MPNPASTSGEMIDQLLRQAHEQALQKRKPLSILRICIDGFGALAGRRQRKADARAWPT